MVWFQCEDCGENLKKPKLPNHFRMCSAFKLSCIDCGETFGQQSVQAHNQCITEAEKYGPKGQGGKPLNSTPAKAKNQSNGKPEVDINVGLSSRAPWYCSLCNTNATSRQALLLHAEGKKHRSKARAFHASKQPPKPAEEATPNITGSDVNTPMEKPLANNGIPKEEPLGNKDAPKEELLSNTDEELKEENRPKDAVDNESTEENGKKVKKSKKKRELLAASENGEVIQAKKHKKEESTDTVKKAGDFDVDKAGHTKEVGKGKIKLKKLITSVLKADPEGALEKRKLQKLVVKAVKESCPTESTKELKEMCMNKINSSSRFAFDEKGRVCLAEKTKT